MSFIDELNQANQKRREAFSDEIRKNAKNLIDYIKNQMMRHVNTGDGHITALTAEAVIWFYAKNIGLYADMPKDKAKEENAAAQYLYIDTCMKNGEGLIFCLRSRQEFDAFRELAEQAAKEADIQEIETEINEKTNSAVMKFTVHLE